MSARIVAPNLLFGRDRELAALYSAYHRIASHGGCECVLVSGSSGIGKSTLVEAFRRSASASPLSFAAGKFSTHRSNVPYGTISQSLRALLRESTDTSPDQQDLHRRSLQDALGTHGSLVSALVPEMEELLGPQAAATDLSQVDMTARFQQVFSRFLQTFARAERPLVLFLDDLHWADPGTIALLEYWLGSSALEHVLLVCALRPDEAAAHPLLASMLSRVRVGSSKVRDVVLAALHPSDIERLVAQALECAPSSAASLADILYAEGGGNPLLTGQLLTRLADQQCVEFDPILARWTWTQVGVQDLRGIGDLDKLLHSKLVGLPAPTLHLVRILSCVRFAASTAQLAFVAQLPEDRVAADLGAAVTNGLVSCTQDTWLCVHDRVREAAYASLDAEERATHHLRIGGTMVNLGGAARPTDASFEAVDQLNRGSILLRDTTCRVWLARLNLVVGNRARLATAYASAASYYREGAELLALDDGALDTSLAFELHLASAECDLLGGALETALERLDVLLSRAQSINEQTAVYRARVTLHVLRAAYSTAVDEAILAMRLHGIEMSAHPSAAELGAALAGVWRQLGQRPIPSLVELPLSADRGFQLAADVMAELLAPACFTDERLAFVHLCHLVRLTLEHGVVPASVQALGWFGIMLGHHHQRHQEAISFAQLAHDLVHRHGFEAFEPKALFALEIAAGWVRPPGTTIALSRAAFTAGSERGDVAVACFACHHTVHDMLLKAEPLHVVADEIASGLVYVRRNGFRDVVDELLTQQRFVEALRGKTASLSDWDGPSFDRSRFEAELTSGRMPDMIFTYWVTRGQALLLAGDMAAAEAALELAATWAWSSPVHARTLNQPYFHALALAALQRSTQGDVQHLVERIEIRQRRLAAWCEHNPALFAPKVALVGAELARLQRRPIDAARLYQEAVSSARKSAIVADEALANEHAARFLFDEHLELLAATHWRAALAAYRRWGATGKVSALLAERPELTEEDTRQAAREADMPAASSAGDSQGLFAAIQSFCGEILPEHLVERLMRTVLEQSGADRGLLIEKFESDWMLSAEALVIESGVSLRLGSFPISSADIPVGVASLVERSASAVRVGDSSRPDPLLAIGASAHARSFICVPLMRQSRVEAMLYLESGNRAFFTDEHQSRVSRIASPAAVALRNARLYEAALRDGEAKLQVQMELESAKQALRESEARFDRIASSTADVIWMTQIEPERVIYVSPSFEDIWGRSCEELYSDPHLWIRAIHPEDQARIGNAFVAWLKHSSDRPWHAEFRVVRPDGTIRWIQERGAYLVEAGLQRVSGISVDITERRIAETAQFELEQRFALAIAASNDGVWHWELASKQMFVSERAQHLCGIAAGNAVRTQPEWQALVEIHPEDRAPAIEALHAYLSGGAPTYDRELRFRHADGIYRWVRIRGLCSHDADGQVHRMAGSISDIDAQKRIESELRQSERRHALAMDAARDGHWDWIIESDEYHASPRMLEIYGIPPETRFSGRDEFLRRLRMPPHDRERWKAASAASFAGQSSRFEFELQVFKEDTNEMRWVRTSGLLLRDESAKPIRYIGSVNDITDRKNSEHALRNSEARFALAVAASSEGIWDLDIATAQMFLSERAQRIFGLSEGPTLQPLSRYRELIGVHPDHREHPFDRLEAYLCGQLPSYEGEWQIAHPDGSFRWVRIRGLCERDEEGRPTRVAGSVGDIDGRKRTEQALQHAQRLESLGTLAGGIAHDFNNILGAILGFGEMGYRSTRPGSKARRDLELIIKAGERGRRLVEGILGFSRSGISERTPVDVKGVAQEALQLISATAAASVRIESRLISSEVVVMGDPTQIHQVLMNLMTNALQAMPHGGSLTLTLDDVHLESELACTTGSVIPGDYLKVSVEDSGVGIAPDLISKVFDPFFTTKEVGSGTGLGLSLVHGIVSELNGAIEVKSALAWGSTFIVYLPRSASIPEPGTAVRWTSPPRGRHQQILVVDDEEPLLQLTSDILKELDYVPVAFGSGVAALAAFTAHPERFDAIVTDERMPGLGGIALIKSVKAIRPQVPVLLVSGYLGISIAERAKHAGAALVLRKPVAAADLAASLARLLAEHGDAAAAGSRLGT
ncbi:MAG: PAS domain-containing protein [Caldimonas sp.]